ncbi:thiol-disulfide oxidoreductase DCC family protein [Qipengyuania sp. NPDC077563]|uniref:thiol-disulfide oxidoreductase DCC family protein n=1 Tax=Qipengyuania sp. NPDC077563 TaxID=3364497 RepID=UPI003850F63C
MTRRPYSYREDPDVPLFDDSRPLFVFDNICLLCSGGANFLMKQDRKGAIAFTSAQGPIGSALYRHYEMAVDETYLFLADGRAYGMSEGYFQLAKRLGGMWRLTLVARLMPRPLRDAIYRMIARNRYRWFGKTQACALLTPEQRARLL